MALATQLTLSLANTTGTLAKLCRDLADAGVNLLALSADDRSDASGPIRLLVASPEQAQKALAKAGYTFQAEEVLFVELKNRPGALATYDHDAPAASEPESKRPGAVTVWGNGSWLVQVTRVPRFTVTIGAAYAVPSIATATAATFPASTEASSRAAGAPRSPGALSRSAPSAPRSSRSE